MELRAPENFFNRELSLLEFNRRVLEQAKDEETPLLERFRFLCISTTNLDEFFEVRVGALKQQIAFGSTQTGPDGLSAVETLRRVSESATSLVAEQYRVLNDLLTPALEAQHIRFVRRSQWNAKQRHWLKRYFTRELLPVLSPIGLDNAHPFPRILNKSLNFIMSLDGRDAFGRDTDVAIVRAPRSLPRLIQLPASISEGPHDFVFLSSILHAHVGDLFPGMTVTGCYQFRVTRNSDLFVDEEEVDNLMSALQGELLGRNYGQAVRLEVADNCPKQESAFLLDHFELEDSDLYQVHGPVNLNRMLALYDMVDRPDLKYPPFTPGVQRRIAQSNDIFQVMQRGDVVLHHPYESFSPVLDLLRQAARDPNVMGIKQTLYRTGADSIIVDLLVEAAQAGKDVTVVVELRARFDEAANIQLANRLQEAGVQVVYGVVGYKTHAKMTLIVRRERGKLKRYCHLSTGNYHTGTVRAYTDIGLLTVNRAIAEDVHKLFQQMTGLGKATRLKNLMQSPFTMHKELIARIRREAKHASEGKPARIIARMNALTEPEMIAELYAASGAGVRIDLIVRGVCSLRPGVAGVSENIAVRSVIGRFLEHTRAYWFQNGDDPELYLSSADLMDRNLHRRVEICFPIEDAKLAERVFEESLQMYLADNVQAWVLQQDGSYKKAKSGSSKPKAAQVLLLEKLAR